MATTTEEHTTTEAGTTTTAMEEEQKEEPKSQNFFHRFKQNIYQVIFGQHISKSSFLLQNARVQDTSWLFQATHATTEFVL